MARPTLTSASITACLALAAAAGPAIAAPTPDFTTSPASVVAGEQAIFTSTSTPTEGQQIVSTEWDLDNDGDFEATGESATHTFASPGTYSVSLRVGDDTPDTQTLTRDVVVVAPTPPTAQFTPPAQPVAAVAATFTSTSSTVPGASISDVQWDFENDGTFDATGDQVSHAFPGQGTYTVRVRVTDTRGLTASTTHVVVVGPPPPPVAGFTVTPAVPVVGFPATFTSTSSGVAGASIASVEWDFGNDGTYEDSGGAVAHTFGAPGAYAVRVHVVDTRGQSADFVSGVTANAAPIAAFTVFPSTPVVGDEVSLTSYSSDAEGALAAQQWDLDGDGDFDDASGAVVTGMFTSAGDHTVSLRVTDGQGATSTFSRTITALAPKKGEAPVLPKSDAPSSKNDSADDVPPFVALVSPFPVVRLVGAVVKGGARIRMLSVRAPKGSKVYVNCRGARCPARRLVKAVGKAPVRFRSLERFLPAGSVLEILVRRGDQIGKYTSFRIRRNRVPKRSDGCLPPYLSRATKCPGA